MPQSMAVNFRTECGQNACKREQQLLHTNGRVTITSQTIFGTPCMLVEKLGGHSWRAWSGDGAPGGVQG